MSADANQSACPVCDAVAWCDDAVASRILDLPANRVVRRCRCCGQGWLYPPLTEVELQALYSAAYFTAHASVPAGAATSAPEVGYMETVAPERRRKFGRTIARLQQLSPRARRFLDVGAATGDMVRIAREAGLEAEGLELSREAIAIAREVNGVELSPRLLRDVAGREIFDLVHLNHVFEHLAEPDAELRAIEQITRPGALLYIEVPYQFHLVERLAYRLLGRKETFNVHSLHHPYFYTPRTLSRLLRRHAFELIEVRVFDRERYADSGQGGLKALLWRLLGVVGVGNYIEVIARRV